MRKSLPIWRLLLRATLLGILAGSVITGFSLREIGMKRWSQNGDWLYQLSVGDASSSVFQKAVIATGGLFALSRSESMYFIAAPQGLDHQHMNGQCHYRIRGTALDTRWWSVTVYGKDRMLIANPEKRYSFSDKTVVWNEDGSFTIDIAPEKTGTNWIPTSDDPRVIVLLRVYNPSQSLMDQIGTVTLPKVEEVSC